MISDKHLAMLAESGVTPEHAALRGYRTITDPKQFGDIAIVKAARKCVPGLLIPLLAIDGTVCGYQYRPDNPRLRDGDGKPVKYETPWKQTNRVDIPPSVAEQLADSSVPLWITEGIKKADCGALHGLCIVGLIGVWNWRGRNSSGGTTALPDWQDIALNNRRVIVAYDGDMWRNENVQKASSALSTYLEFKGAKVEYLWLPDTDAKTGLDDYLMDGHSIDDLWQLVKTEPPGDDSQPMLAAPIVEPKPAAAVPVSLDAAHKVFRRWLGKSFDTDALDIMLATAAMAEDEGDPVWVIFISGSGNAKTEMVQALKGMGAEVTSAISSAGALLSATSNKEKAADATGGLLPKLQKAGIGVLVVKDFTTILSMDRNARAEVMAALREVYDGRYQRNVGTDGGKTLTWEGRLVVVGACTTAWDRAHAVISVMGNRFVLVRTDSDDDASREQFGMQSIDNLGSESVMREQLTAAVGGVLAGRIQPPKLTRPESLVLVRAANLATKIRTAVETDYQGNVDDAHAAEAPTRLAKQLAQVVRGAMALGIDRTRAMQLAIRCAADSVPPMLLTILRDLDGEGEYLESTAASVAKRIDKPRTSVDRQLQALHALKLATVKPGSSPWDYRLKAGVDMRVLDPKACPEMLVQAYKDIEERRESEDDDASLPTNKSGQTSDEDASLPTNKSGQAVNNAGSQAPEREMLSKREVAEHLKRRGLALSPDEAAVIPGRLTIKPTTSTAGTNGQQPAEGVSEIDPVTKDVDQIDTLCRDCGIKPSAAGKTHCDSCQRTHENVMRGYE